MFRVMTSTLVFLAVFFHLGLTLAQGGLPPPGTVLFEQGHEDNPFGHAGMLDRDRGDGPHVLDSMPGGPPRRVPLSDWLSGSRYVGYAVPDAGRLDAVDWAHAQYAGRVGTWEIYKNNCSTFIAKAYDQTGNPIGGDLDATYIKDDSIVPDMLWKRLGNTTYLNELPIKSELGPYVAPTSSGSGGGGGEASSPSTGGVESRPLWLTGGGSGGAGHLVAAALMERVTPELQGLQAIRDDPSAVSNALAVRGIGYHRGGQRHAAYFAALTHGGSYDHSYATCQRFHGHRLLAVETHQLGGHPYACNMVQLRSGVMEYQLGATVLVHTHSDRVSFEVLSQWLNSDFARSGRSHSGHQFNLSVWARDMDTTRELLRDALKRLAALGEVRYLDAPPRVPARFVARGIHSQGAAELEVYSAEPAYVPLVVESWARPGAAKVRSERQLYLKQGRSTHSFPLVARNALLTMASGTDLDEVLLDSGYWFHFADNSSGGASTIKALDTVTCSSSMAFPVAEASIRLSDCARMDASLRKSQAIAVPYAGMARTVGINGATMDLSRMEGLTFWARGTDRTFRVKLETADHHFEAQFRPGTGTGKFRRVHIRLADLGTAARAWTGKGIKVISFVTLQADEPDTSVELTVDRIAFVRGLRDTGGGDSPPGSSLDPAEVPEVGCSVAANHAPAASLFWLLLALLLIESARRRGAVSFDLDEEAF